MDNSERVKAFMDELYEEIKHGDEAHREWLRLKLTVKVPDLLKLVNEACMATVDEMIASLKKSMTY